MNIRKSIHLSIVVLTAVSASAQVNLQTGAPQFSIPLFNYSSNDSKLNTGVSLIYAPGNGIKANDESSEVGLGWVLGAAGSVARVRVGEPDDQLQKTINNKTYIKAGLFNQPPVQNQNDYKLGWAPAYTSGSTHTYYDPNVHFDREHDEFAFSFNGRSGKFILGTDAFRTPLLFEKSGLNIQTVEQLPSGDNIGSIAGFRVTDENGIVYKFLNPLFSAVLDYVKSCYVKNTNRFTPIPPFSEAISEVVCDEPGAEPRNVIPHNSAYATNTTQFEIFVPKETGYYIANLWYLSEIRNPATNEVILFEYENKEYKANKNFMASVTMSDYYINGGTRQWQLNITENYESYKYPQLSAIKMPGNKEIRFLYNSPRKDQIGKHALNEISYYEDAVLLYKYKLKHGYFYKSSVLDETALPAGYRSKDVALCLQSVQKIGADELSVTPPTTFEYNTGIPGDPNITFRERFHLSKDYWDYNNFDGNFSAYVTSYGDNISMPALDEYLSNPEQHRMPSGDVTLLTIGMLKQTKNENGGITKYIYEPNKALYGMTETLSGGVRVKEIVLTDNHTGHTYKKEYKYILADGQSSGYGYERPDYDERGRGIWVVPAQSKYKRYAPVLKSFVMSAIPANSLASSILGSASLVKGYFDIMATTIKNPVQGVKAIGITTYLHFALRNHPVLATAFSLYSAFRATGLFSSLAYREIDVKTYTKRMDFISSQNYINALYSRVEEVTSGHIGNNPDLRNGKKVYEFYSTAETPLLISEYGFPYTQRQRKLDWAYGLPKRELIYNESGTLISEKEYVYDIKGIQNNEERYKSVKPASPTILISPDDPDNDYGFTNFSGLITPDFIWESYNPFTGGATLTSIKEKLYDNNGNYLETITQSGYNQINQLPNYTKRIDSKGKTIETRTYYPTDYSAGAVIAGMVQRNMIAPPVSTETWQTKPGGQPELLGASVTEYGSTPNGDYKPLKSYSLQSAGPVPLATIGSFDPAQLIRNPSLIKADMQYTYDAAGNIVQTNDLQGNRVSSVLFDYNNRYPVAAIANAAGNEVAYTSFEADGANSNWNLANNWIVNDLVPTGGRCLEFSWGNITTPIAITKDYTLSLWATSNSFTVSGGIAPTIIGPTINGWTFYQYKLPAGSASPVIAGTFTSLCRIDELRLYPSNAGIATTTYSPGVGKTSVCDLNNRISYFEYDALGRLSRERDEQRNIIKTYEYHYKQ